MDTSVPTRFCARQKIVSEAGDDEDRRRDDDEQQQQHIFIITAISDDARAAFSEYI
jgi:hypothetical protein